MKNQYTKTLVTYFSRDHIWTDTLRIWLEYIPDAYSNSEYAFGTSFASCTGSWDFFVARWGRTSDTLNPAKNILFHTKTGSLFTNYLSFIDHTYRMRSLFSVCFALADIKNTYHALPDQIHHQEPHQIHLNLFSLCVELFLLLSLLLTC